MGVNVGFDRNASLVRAWIDAVNDRDRDRFASLLAPDIELRTRRGSRSGRESALAWFDRPFESLDLRIEPGRYVVGEDWVLGTGTVRLYWTDGGELADETDGVAVWWLAEPGVSCWQPFDRMEDALTAVGLT
jgi:SnoaL-like domain